jgi:CBS domain-containing protein
MTVGDLMVRRVSVCGPDSNLAEIAAIMWNDRCGAVPVIDEAGHITSMITDRDVCIALGTRNARASEVRVKDVSLPRVFTCNEDEDVHHALDTMVAQNVRRLPVVDAQGKLVGILSVDDILRNAGENIAGTVISCEETVVAVKAILEGRSRNYVHPPSELAATHS